jgi:hypothetical protein
MGAMIASRAIIAGLARKITDPATTLRTTTAGMTALETMGTIGVALTRRYILSHRYRRSVMRKMEFLRPTNAWLSTEAIEIWSAIRISRTRVAQTSSPGPTAGTGRQDDHEDERQKRAQTHQAFQL